MVVVLKENPDQNQLESLIQWLTDKNIQVFRSQGQSQMILGLVGDTTQIDADLISALDIVDSVKRIQEPYKKVNRKFHPQNTVVSLSNEVHFGDGSLVMIAGPSSVESEEQIFNLAKEVKEAGAQVLRGGTYKPRTSPYSFQGMQEEGVRLLVAAGKEYHLPVVTEIMSIQDLDAMRDVDILQVGTRNMQDYALLEELGKSGKTVLLKRGPAATYEDFLMSAEYIMSKGNSQIILCETGIRTFEDYTRSTLDIAAVPVLKQHTHLPVIVDPSRSSGRADLVEPLATAATAAGADGLMIEVHDNPQYSVTDGREHLVPGAYKVVLDHCRKIHELINGEA